MLLLVAAYTPLLLAWGLVAIQAIGALVVQHRTATAMTRLATAVDRLVAQRADLGPVLAPDVSYLVRPEPTVRESCIPVR